MKKTSLLLLFGLLSSCLVAQIKYIFQPVSKHVYAAVPEHIGRVSTTSTVVVGHSFLTVIEAPSDIGMGRALMDQLRKQFSTLPIRYLIFTHFHGDHSLGAASFKEAFPEITVIAHPYTRKMIQTYIDTNDFGSLPILEAKLAEAQKNWEKENSLAEKQKYKSIAESFRRYIDDTKNSRWLLPNITVADSLVLFDDSLEIKIIHPGHGHTPSDLIIHLPTEKVIVTGDLVHDYDPYLIDAIPENWISILSKIEQYDFDYLIGGHGKPQKGKEVLRSFRNYLTELIAIVKHAQRNNLTLQQVQASVNPQTVQALVVNDYGKHIARAATASGAVHYFNWNLEGSLAYSLETLWNYYAGPPKK